MSAVEPPNPGHSAPGAERPTAPRFSVVIPFYNKRAHIGRAVASVLGQGVRDLELVVVDDGSTDGGGDVVAAIDDPRLRLLRQPNQGVSAARNRGIAETTGPHIALLDADDEWAPGFLGEIDALVGEFPQAIIHATAYRLAAGGHSRPMSNWKAMGGGPEHRLIDYLDCLARDVFPFSASSVCVGRVAFERAGGFEPGLAVGDDVLMWIRLAQQGMVAWSNAELSFYHRDAENRALEHPLRLERELDFLVHLVAHCRGDWHDSAAVPALRRFVSSKIAGTAARLLRGDDPARARQFLDCNRDLLLYRHALRLQARLLRHGIARRLASRTRADTDRGGRR